MKQTIQATALFLALFSFTACIDSSDSVQNPTDSPSALVAEKPTAMQGVFVEGKGIFTCPNGVLFQTDSAFTEKLTAAKGRFMPDYPLIGKVCYVEVTANALGGQLTVNNVDSMANMTPYNTCVPYEYWCSGTEPFWDFVVSEKMDMALCFDMGELTLQCAYAKPTQLPDGTKQYLLPLISGKGGKVELLVQKRSCNDGMSERKFFYKAEVRSPDRVLQGCAIEYGTAQVE